MSGLTRPRFRSVKGGIKVSLPDDERDILTALLEQFRELLIVGDDPNLARLRPVARPDDPEADRAYAAMVGDQLLRQRLEAIETVEASLGGAVLGADETSAWLQTINGLRLVLGERLEVSEDLELIDEDDPEAPAYALYEWLGWLLDQLVRSASADLPDIPDDQPGQRG